MESSNMSYPSIEMPKYKCHKEVWALKIVAIEHKGIGGLLHFEPPCAPIAVSMDYMTKHDPSKGGYYVVYKGGYKSYSPADVFEEGYTLIK